MAVPGAAARGTNRRGPARRAHGPSRSRAAWQPLLYRHHRLVGPDAAQTQAPVLPVLLPVVRPRPDVPPAHIVERMSRPSDEGRSSGRRGAGDPMSLRGFVSGDPVSSVHWRSTARTGSPVVMEREQPLSGRLVLLVAGAGEGEQWEAAVARAAGLVQAAAATGVPVSRRGGSCRRAAAGRAVARGGPGLAGRRSSRPVRPQPADVAGSRYAGRQGASSPCSASSRGWLRRYALPVLSQGRSSTSWPSRW